NRSLARAFFEYPLVTLKVIGGIHWEALKLWAKGTPSRRRGAPPAHDVTVLPHIRPSMPPNREVA
ncbi:MAG TPA: DUF1365 family protein, partial [Actinomycetota bacterium]|nr:DUF1365 family protein [Actinomycetota bacterium]